MITWFDLLAVQGTLKNPLQHQSLKASILQHSGFFMVQNSHPYMTVPIESFFSILHLCAFRCLFLCVFPEAVFTPQQRLSAHS